MKEASVQICSVSWIDEKPLPKPGFWFVAGAAMSWPKRVIMGLVGTSNPEPPVKLSIPSFTARKHYRALLACNVSTATPPRTTDVRIDPGWTPPFDKSKLDTVLRRIAPIPEDQKSYPGEASPLSGVVVGRLHECSTLILPRDSVVLASCFIKFRAGAHTDNIGIKEANSPVHVPWVWCEHALISSRGTYQLLCNGSIFPSHAWYVNGEQVAKRLQNSVTDSERDPAISVGQPAAQPQLNAATDKSTGPAAKHQYSLSAGKQICVPLPMS